MNRMGIMGRTTTTKKEEDLDLIKTSTSTSLPPTPPTSSSSTSSNSSSSSTETTTRSDMTSYWKEHAKDSATIEAMMLDTNAKTLSEQEVPEILSKLPSWANQDVLELASGIGRYTHVFQESVRSITAVEFMPNFHLANEQRHAALTHVRCVCQDVTTYHQPPNSVDLIFINWLLMYLGEGELLPLMQRALEWLRPGGHIFIRESCFKQSGNANREQSGNPTNYRHPREYIALLDAAAMTSRRSSCSSHSAFQLVRSGSVNTYRTLKQNPGQIWFLWKKVTAPAPVVELEDPQGFRVKLRRYEHMYGRGYISPVPGRDMIQQLMLSCVDQRQMIQPRDHVLQLGCNLAGDGFHMAKEWHARVVGLECMDVNMLHVALERAMTLPQLDLQLEMNTGWVMQNKTSTGESHDEGFDVIYSRETVGLLAGDTPHELFRQCLLWLKPGGHFIFTDLIDGRESSIAHYEEILTSIGFVHVTAMDQSAQYLDSLKSGLKNMQSRREAVIADMSGADYEWMVEHWRTSIERVSLGNQRWGWYTAMKKEKE